MKNVTSRILLGSLSLFHLELFRTFFPSVNIRLFFVRRVIALATYFLQRS